MVGTSRQAPPPVGARVPPEVAGRSVQRVKIIIPDNERGDAIAPTFNEEAPAFTLDSLPELPPVLSAS